MNRLVIIVAAVISASIGIAFAGDESAMETKSATMAKTAQPSPSPVGANDLLNRGDWYIRQNDPVVALTDEQKEKIRAIFSASDKKALAVLAEMNPQITHAMKQLSAAKESGDWAAMVAAQKAYNDAMAPYKAAEKEAQTQAEALLSPEQLAKMKEFYKPEPATPVTARPAGFHLEYYIGLATEAITPPKLANAKLPPHGLVIRGVVPSSPAEQAGLKAGEFLISAGDQQLNTPKDLEDAVAKAKDTELVLTKYQNGKPQQVTVRPAKIPADGIIIIGQSDPELIVPNIKPELLKAEPQKTPADQTSEENQALNAKLKDQRGGVLYRTVAPEDMPQPNKQPEKTSAPLPGAGPTTPDMPG